MESLLFASGYFVDLWKSVRGDDTGRVLVHHPAHPDDNHLDSRGTFVKVIN